MSIISNINNLFALLNQESEDLNASEIDKLLQTSEKLLKKGQNDKNNEKVLRILDQIQEISQQKILEHELYALIIANIYYIYYFYVSQSDTTNEKTKATIAKYEYYFHYLLEYVSSVSNENENSKRNTIFNQIRAKVFTIISDITNTIDRKQLILSLEESEKIFNQCIEMLLVQKDVYESKDLCKLCLILMSRFPEQYDTFISGMLLILQAKYRVLGRSQPFETADKIALHPIIFIILKCQVEELPILNSDDNSFGNIAKIKELEDKFRRIPLRIGNFVKALFKLSMDAQKATHLKDFIKLFVEKVCRCQFSSEFPTAILYYQSLIEEIGEYIIAKNVKQTLDKNFLIDIVKIMIEQTSSCQYRTRSFLNSYSLVCIDGLDCTCNYCQKEGFIRILYKQSMKRQSSAVSVCDSSTKSQQNYIKEEGRSASRECINNIDQDEGKLFQFEDQENIKYMNVLELCQDCFGGKPTTINKLKKNISEEGDGLVARNLIDVLSSDNTQMHSFLVVYQSEVMRQIYSNIDFLQSKNAYLHILLYKEAIPYNFFKQVEKIGSCFKHSQNKQLENNNEPANNQLQANYQLLHHIYCQILDNSFSINKNVYMLLKILIYLANDASQAVRNKSISSFSCYRFFPELFMSSDKNDTGLQLNKLIKQHLLDGVQSVRSSALKIICLVVSHYKFSKLCDEEINLIFQRLSDTQPAIRKQTLIFFEQNLVKTQTNKQFVHSLIKELISRSLNDIEDISQQALGILSTLLFPHLRLQKETAPKQIKKGQASTNSQMQRQDSLVKDSSNLLTIVNSLVLEIQQIPLLQPEILSQCIKYYQDHYDSKLQQMEPLVKLCLHEHGELKDDQTNNQTKSIDNQEDNISRRKAILIILSVFSQFLPQVFFNDLETLLNYFKSYYEKQTCSKIKGSGSRQNINSEEQLQLIIQILINTLSGSKSVMTLSNYNRFDKIEGILEEIIYNENYFLLKSSLKLYSICILIATSNVKKAQIMFIECFKYMMDKQIEISKMNKSLSNISDYSSHIMRSQLIVTILSTYFSEHLFVQKQSQDNSLDNNNSNQDSVSLSINNSSSEDSHLNMQENQRTKVDQFQACTIQDVFKSVLDFANLSNQDANIALRKLKSASIECLTILWQHNHYLIFESKELLKCYLCRQEYSSEDEGIIALIYNVFSQFLQQHEQVIKELNYQQKKEFNQQQNQIQTQEKGKASSSTAIRLNNKDNQSNKKNNSFDNISFLIKEMTRESIEKHIFSKGMTVRLNLLKVLFQLINQGHCAFQEYGEYIIALLCDPQEEIRELANAIIKFQNKKNYHSIQFCINSGIKQAFLYLQNNYVFLRQQDNESSPDEPQSDEYEEEENLDEKDQQTQQSLAKKLEYAQIQGSFFDELNSSILQILHGHHQKKGTTVSASTSTNHNYIPSLTEKIVNTITTLNQEDEDSLPFLVFLCSILIGLKQISFSDLHLALLTLKSIADSYIYDLIKTLKSIKYGELFIDMDDQESQQFINVLFILISILQTCHILIVQVATNPNFDQAQQQQESRNLQEWKLHIQRMANKEINGIPQVSVIYDKQCDIKTLVKFNSIVEQSSTQIINSDWARKINRKVKQLYTRNVNFDIENILNFNYNYKVEEEEESTQQQLKRGKNQKKIIKDANIKQVSRLKSKTSKKKYFQKQRLSDYEDEKYEDKTNKARNIKQQQQQQVTSVDRILQFDKQISSSQQDQNTNINLLNQYKGRLRTRNPYLSYLPLVEEE